MVLAALEICGSQTFDVQPDMLTCAKALSSAYLPISAVMMFDKVYASLAEQAGPWVFLAMAIPIRRTGSGGGSIARPATDAGA